MLIRPERPQLTDNDHKDHQRTRISGKFTELAGAKSETSIVGVGAGVALDEGEECQRCGMGGHGPSICYQSHRSLEHPVEDLNDHHCRREQNHTPDLALILDMLAGEKSLTLCSTRKRVGMHPSGSLWIG